MKDFFPHDPGSYDPDSAERVFNLASRDEFKRLVPDLKKINAGVGNTDLRDLQSENASINGFGPCGGMKPNLEKYLVQIQSVAFYQYDPPVIFYDKDAKLPSRVSDFIAKYMIWRRTLTTNQLGQRNTLPLVDRARKVLVTGDSVAMGLGVSDDESLASQLQRLDRSRQYVNVAISGAGSETNLCTLDQAQTLYPGKIDALVYVFCDNDFRYDEHDSLVAKLKEFQVKNGVKHITFVRAPFIRSMPPVLRDGPEEENLRKRVRSLASEVKSAGFAYLDIAELFAKASREQETIFGGLPLYLDHVHLSPLGLRTLAKHLHATGDLGLRAP